jgi:hypothetical protein
MSKKGFLKVHYPHWLQEYTDFLLHINPNAANVENIDYLYAVNIHYSVSCKTLEEINGTTYRFGFKANLVQQSGHE